MRWLTRGMGWFAMLQYKNGKVHIHREWEQHKRLTPDWVDDCCTELKYVCARCDKCIADECA